jgi:hypothetical protein
MPVTGARRWLLAQRKDHDETTPAHRRADRRIRPGLRNRQLLFGEHCVARFEREP